jgi:FdhD protein
MVSHVKRKIVKVQGRVSKNAVDTIGVEKKLRVRVNGQELITVCCTPLLIKELLAGLLFTEGILSEKDQMKNLHISTGKEITADISLDRHIPKEGFPFIRSLGGITLHKKRFSKRINNTVRIQAESLIKVFRRFQSKSKLFALTGCFHSAALSDGERIIAFAEDIGRHNAVDKVIGSAILKDMSLKHRIMLVSCRISSEIISKCAQWNIAIIASGAAPTDLAIKIARDSGVALIGFLRGKRMNIYTYAEKIEV